MLENIKREDFEKFLKTKFRVNDDFSNFVELELVEVVNEMNDVDDGYERFSLFFHLPGNQLIPQATYKMEHEQLGQFELFIVPTGRVPDGYSYQATFSRRKV